LTASKVPLALGRTKHGAENDGEEPQYFQMLSPNAKAAWAEVWHLWTVIIPRRSITGRLVLGKVWRRHDGRHWTYKKFVEYRMER
jgi:hypothetical protein